MSNIFLIKINLLSNFQFFLMWKYWFLLDKIKYDHEFEKKGEEKNIKKEVSRMNT